MPVEMWQAKGRVPGPQAASFFPPSHAERKEKSHARASGQGICSECHVRDDCLDYAIRIREPTASGRPERDERKLFLERRAAKHPPAQRRAGPAEHGGSRVHHEHEQRNVTSARPCTRCRCSDDEESGGTR